MIRTLTSILTLFVESPVQANATTLPKAFLSFWNDCLFFFKLATVAFQMCLNERATHHGFLLSFKLQLSFLRFFPPARRYHIDVLAKIFLIYIHPLFLHPLSPFSYLVSTSSFSFFKHLLLAFPPLLTNYFSFQFSSGRASVFSCGA